MKAVITIFVLLAFGSTATAQDWPTWGGPPGGSKYSKLDQINLDNVDQLEVAWTYRAGNYEGKMGGFGNSFGLQAVPILLPEEAGGHLVLCDPFWRVIALDPLTGEVRWEMKPEIEKGLRNLQYKCRGVSQWEDTEAPDGTLCKYRIFQVTGERRMFSMDANTGKLCPGFGNTENDGELVMDEDIGSIPHAHDVEAIRTYFPPAIVSDSVIIGSVVGTKFLDANAPSGAVYAFDARTGKMKWYWDPIPRDPSDPAYETWDPEQVAVTGGGNVWTYMTTDPERDLVFLPTGSPSPNYYGINRQGNNLYANSTVALRGSTGERVWHYQVVRHDIWDWDTAVEPMAIEVTKDGVTTPAIVQLTKQGLTYLFDRETGEPLIEIKEQPVDTEGGLPGEYLPPTQPFPVKPRPLNEMITTKDDAWGFTFWDRGKCEENYDKYDHGTIFTPPSERGLLIHPGMVNNWGGGAFDPETNMLVTNYRRFSLFVAVFPVEELELDDPDDPRQGFPSGPPGVMRNTETPVAPMGYAMERGPEKAFGPLFSPCISPPWYVLAGIDMSTGDIKWEVPLGTLDKMMRLPLPLKFGAVGIGGPMITAGGLTFIGATSDETFRAFETATGEEVWQDALPTSNMTVPMTYERDGRQFIVLAAGGHHIFYGQKVSDWLIAYALPE
ncbi:MAG: PQQ-binding-like beta-propeller repeat protein [Gammaproteobacteria bacterium]|jgi:quinoprotein glucose dehydrogenase|nr:PQQ-binding-like beta-propeller repeat protein [Gammaproteobacteria bacterium]MDP6616461.1 PQQ-binding-like beta-propeller repeat protein [Gammaproteobacteria bacterium]MDP6695844.1 PQQ-binding-like beta-propeller repeat protein [Gammaproteobacteria bacterium]